MSQPRKTAQRTWLTSFADTDARRTAGIVIPWSSLLALPQSYIVPGGRFSETYYWGLLYHAGLAKAGAKHLLKCMADTSPDD